MQILQTNVYMHETSECCDRVPVMLKKFTVKPNNTMKANVSLLFLSTNFYKLFYIKQMYIFYCKQEHAQAELE